MARRDDGRWSTAILLWEPDHGRRAMGHPVSRWRDDLDCFANEYLGALDNEWFLLTPDREGWSSFEKEYADKLRRDRRDR